METTPQNIIVQLLKAEDKEKAMKAVREKQQVIWTGTNSTTDS